MQGVYAHDVADCNAKSKKSSPPDKLLDGLLLSFVFVTSRHHRGNNRIFQLLCSVY